MWEKRYTLLRAIWQGGISIPPVTPPPRIFVMPMLINLSQCSVSPMLMTIIG